MNRLLFMCATTLTTATLLTASYAEGTKAAPSTTLEKPVADQPVTASTDLEAKKEFLSHIYEAQIQLHSKNGAETAKHLQQANETLQGIHPAGPYESGLADAIDKKAYLGAKAVEIAYGPPLMTEKTVIPITEADVTIETLEDTVNMTGIERGTVKDAEVRYIAFDFDRDKVQKQLNQAQKKLAEQDFSGAQEELRKIQRDVLEDSQENIPAKIRARDHLALARFMMQKAEYDAAREAMDSARNALNNMQGQAEATAINAELQQLAGTINDRDPTALQKLDKKLEEWWNQLS